MPSIGRDCLGESRSDSHASSRSPGKRFALASWAASLRASTLPLAGFQRFLNAAVGNQLPRASRKLLQQAAAPDCER